MNRFFVDPKDVQGDRVVVRSDQAHHLRDVLRLREGDPATVFDGSGWEYDGRVQKISQQEVLILILRKEKRTAQKRFVLSLAQAIPKGDRMDWLVQKATELGVANLFPVITERSVVRPQGSSVQARRRRWERIAQEAAKQCGRVDVPVIFEAMPFSKFLESADEFQAKWIACLDLRAVGLKGALSKAASSPRQNSQSILALIGPEGDFTPHEITQAQSTGFIPISFGPSVLRSETAGIYLASILMYESNA